MWGEVAFCSQRGDCKCQPWAFLGSLRPDVPCWRFVNIFVVVWESNIGLYVKLGVGGLERAVAVVAKVDVVRRLGGACIPSPPRPHPLQKHRNRAPKTLPTIAPMLSC
ncbi:hypothetical protein BASA81_000982 [Batrachochytrium salamandrivorans]|nr:hypothetical protein BASA81_000982 [Batrachochytrium salamandrivorans]